MRQAFLWSNDGLVYWQVYVSLGWNEWKLFLKSHSTTYFTDPVPVKPPRRIWLTHWGRMTHICVGKLTIIGSDNGLSPRRRQAIIWTNAGLLLIRQLGTNFSEILIGFQIFSFKKMHLKMSSAKWRSFCLGLDVLKSTKTQQRANRVPICCNALYSTECRRNAGTSIAMCACGYYAKKTGTIFDLLQCICTR